MTRAFLVVMDSVGIGGALDAADFGDAGADTLGHIAAECAAGRADIGRKGPLHLPNLDRLGLGRAAELATGVYPPGFSATPTGPYAAANEVSQGKDTPSGHWELAGMPVPFDWHYFPDTHPAFPPDLIARMVAQAELAGILGDCHASGTEIIERLGEASVETGMPIVYTSADSVVQIAAHEGSFGLDRLYALCEIAAAIFHPLMVGRVIARPFLGSTAANFKRTPNRRDYAITPPEATLCNRVESAGGRTLAVGKIGDIFAHSGITQVFKGKDDMALFDALVGLADTAEDGDFVFANFVQFDSDYGHRRDVAGYARALEQFDARLPELLDRLRPSDMLIITADHGNDPTWRGTEHTRERVPVLVHGGGHGARALGQVGFADVGETIAAHLGLTQGKHGRSFL